jgi:hypothetical protein
VSPETDRPPPAETFTPGGVPSKLVAVGLGVSLLIVGAAWLIRPTLLLLAGASARAEVVEVQLLKPGQDPIRLTSNKAVGAAEDYTRNGIFTYVVAFTPDDGRPVRATYDVGHVVRAQYRIGQTLNIRFDPDDPTDLTAPRSIATWTFGGFFAGIGLIIIITQGWVLFYARRPIVITPLHIRTNEPVATTASPAAPDEKPPSNRD